MHRVGVQVRTLQVLRRKKVLRGINKGYQSTCALFSPIVHWLSHGLSPRGFWLARAAGGQIGLFSEGKVPSRFFDRSRAFWGGSRDKEWVLVLGTFRKGHVLLYQDGIEPCGCLQSGEYATCLCYFVLMDKVDHAKYLDSVRTSSA